MRINGAVIVTQVSVYLWTVGGGVSAYHVSVIGEVPPVAMGTRLKPRNQLKSV